MLSSAAFTTGFGVSLSLILAIGAQNAFVLRQGIRNEHVLPVVLACALSDAILISFGVGGFREILAGAPWIDPLLRYGGAAFLAWYGACNLRSAFRATSGLAVDGGQAGRRPVSGERWACAWPSPGSTRTSIWTRWC